MGLKNKGCSEILQGTTYIRNIHDKNKNNTTIATMEVKLQEI
jgi:hypothetical protein